MARRRRTSLVAVVALAAIGRMASAREPSWAAELRDTHAPTCADLPPERAPAGGGGAPGGARHRARRRRRSSFLRLFGFGGSGSDAADDAPFKLPKLGLQDALVGAFGIMIFGLLVGANI
ncbi:hypothetical protein KFE25_011131 [Diacronema lutheri]|uniref:Uncharacterized protein n=1 Tax=Diacronema lutheri TaxID=2081491 RepID=A0A8J6C7W3_DIALT|nr:hypothetical protein KFE25_011131 [Diacronema lutheri]